MYLAKDAAILRTLAERTGMHILTNTGQYKPPYLPDATFSLSAEELASQWVEEWHEGIDGTGVCPGSPFGTHCGNWLAARAFTIQE